MTILEAAIEILKKSGEPMSAAIGLYPREAREAAVALRLDPCPGG